MEEDQISGNGTPADFINSAGDNYLANQTSFDAVDNGQASQAGTSAQVSNPGWLSSLGSIFSAGAQVVTAAKELTGKTTAPAATVAKPAAGVGSKLAGSPAIWLVVAAIIGIAAWFILRRK